MSRGVLRRACIWTLCTGLCLAPVANAQITDIGPGFLGLPVSQVVVSGNAKTQEKWVLDWAGIRPGDLLTVSRLRQARQEILDTDLFRTVELRAERYENGEIVLHIVLEERRYWLLLPRLSRNADGDVKFGMRLRVYNLQGADRTLQVLAQQEQQGDGDESEELRIGYMVPFYASPYEMSLGLRHEIENTEVEDFDNTETVTEASVVLSRDLEFGLFDIPLTIAGGVVLQERELDRPYPDSIEAREAGIFNRLILAFTLDDLHSERYREYGSYYSVVFARGYEWLGSDYDSDLVEFEAIRKHRLNSYDNFDFRLAAAVANDSPFNYPAFSIGGGSTVRGLESVDDRGDARVFANFEYVWAYRRHPGLRHTLFLDVGNIYDDLDDVDLGDLRFTLGTGFRWKIDAFVRTDLFFDYGYDFEERAGKLYGGTSLPF